MLGDNAGEDPFYQDENSEFEKDNSDPNQSGVQKLLWEMETIFDL